MQHPVHYLCDVCDFVTDKTREIYCFGDSRKYSGYEVISILNEIGRFIIAKENEALEEGGTNDQE